MSNNAPIYPPNLFEASPPNGRGPLSFRKITKYDLVGVVDSTGGGTVTTTGSPVSTNIAAFSSPTSITAATSLEIQTVIGVGVYDVSGAASTAQANAEAYASDASNLSTGIISSSRIPNPTTSTLGGVEAVSPVAHEWVNSINTSGVPQLSQPSFSDISGTATPSQLPLATSSTFGIVKPDNTTIMISGGVISSVSTGSGLPFRWSNIFSGG